MAQFPAEITKSGFIWKLFSLRSDDNLDLVMLLDMELLHEVKVDVAVELLQDIKNIESNLV